MSGEESFITEAMVKKATYLIHKLADQKNETFETIRSKCKKMFGYVNLAKLSLEDGHAMISKLSEMTGGEEEKPQLSAKPNEKLKATVKDNLTHEKTVREPNGTEVTQVQEPKNDLRPQLPTKPSEPKREIKKESAEKEEDIVTATMRASVRAAVDITLKEIVAKEVPVQGLGGVVLEISKVIFEAKMKAEDK